MIREVRESPTFYSPVSLHSALMKSELYSARNR
jgi:hypothetical protein